MNIKEHRLHNIDNAKGIATLLVVLGHSLQFSGNSTSVFYYLIYSFHMPLFFVISGYLFKIKESFIKKLFLRIFVPFVFWSFLLLFFRNIFDEAYNSLDLSYFIYSFIPSGFWFLYVVFALYLIAYSYGKFKSIYPFVFVILLIIFFVSLFGLDFMSINLILWNSPFFISGYLVRKFSLGFKGNYYFYLALYSLLFVFWSISFEGFTLNEIVFSKFYYLIIRFLTPLVAIIALFLFLSRYSFRSKFLVFFSDNSLGFYVIQTIVFIFVLQILPEIGALVLFIVTLSITSFLVYLSTKNNVFRILVGLQ